MAAMKFAMEAQALTEHTRHGETNNTDLRGLVNQLLAAAEPLSNKFNGPAKAAFDNFKTRVDNVSTKLHDSHVGLLNSASTQNTVFTTASNESMDTHTRSDASAAFDSAVTKNV